MKCPCCGGEVNENVIYFGEFHAFYGGREMKLARNLVRVLKYLYLHKYQLAPHKDLVVLCPYVSNKISNLNNALHAVDAPFVIRSVRGEGYRMELRCKK